jgi:hypothetical protein
MHLSDAGDQELMRGIGPQGHGGGEQLPLPYGTIESRKLLA